VTKHDDRQALLAENSMLRGLLEEALSASIHNPACAYLHHDVDPQDVGKCSCWRGKAAKLFGKPTPPATGVRPPMIKAGK